MKLLLAPREPVTQPTVPNTPSHPLPPPLPDPVSPGTMVTTGQRKVTGKKEWQSLREEIERELTEDAELDMTWRIVKKRPN
jgi:hypothetical protein